MISISRLNKETIPMASQLISKLNTKPQHHIGYLGTDAEEIAHFFGENFDEVGVENCFVAAYENNQMVGLLGFDGDQEGAMGEMWGPFVDHDDWKCVADRLWDEIKSRIPDYIKTLGIFCGDQNTNCLGFALAKDFVQHSMEYVLSIEKTQVKKIENEDLLKLTPQYYSQFIELHDKLFPGTYYSGTEIIDRIDQCKQVFMLAQDNQLQGYIYVEFNEEFGEGSIEFIGVSPDYRGKGYGQGLLEGGLSWIFNKHDINKLNLCVNGGNVAAINLYIKAGFSKMNKLVFLKKAI